MRVGIIQSNYIPWRGYFDFIDDVDLFVFHDDLQYTKGDWRNRNRIRTPEGLAWLTVPVNHERTSQRICDTPVCRATEWEAKHLRRVRECYKSAPAVDDAISILEGAFSHRDPTLSALNIRLIRAVCDYLDIGTPTAMSADLGASGAKTARLIGILRNAGATAYLSGPTARDYLDESQFRESGIRLEYKTYDYPPYPQERSPFEGAVSVIDLIANTGREARNWLKSRTPPEVAVP